MISRGCSVLPIWARPFGPVYFILRARAVRVLNHRCRVRNAIVLTYDDGPGAECTPVLNRLLCSYDARATFFLLGRRSCANPDLVQTLCDGGHEIGAHSHHHLNACNISGLQAVADIDMGYRTLAPWIRSDALFRPPHGKLSFATWRALRARGCPICWWTLDSGDTWPELPDPSACIEKVLRDRGGVVLMHDHDRAPERMRFVLSLTEQLLQTAKREGMNVMTISELFRN